MKPSVNGLLKLFGDYLGPRNQGRPKIVCVWTFF